MSRARDKGTYLETQTVRLAKDLGFPRADRLRLSSPFGDLLGFPGVVEVKNRKAMDLSTWCNQAEKSTKAAKAPWWVVIHNRIRKSVGKNYATTDVDTMIEFMRCYALVHGGWVDNDGYHPEGSLRTTSND